MCFFSYCLKNNSFHLWWIKYFLELARSLLKSVFIQRMTDTFLNWENKFNSKQKKKIEELSPSNEMASFFLGSRMRILVTTLLSFTGCCVPETMRFKWRSCLSLDAFLRRWAEYFPPLVPLTWMASEKLSSTCSCLLVQSLYNRATRVPSSSPLVAVLGVLGNFHQYSFTRFSYRPRPTTTQYEETHWQVLATPAGLLVLAVVNLWWFYEYIFPPVLLNNPLWLLMYLNTCICMYTKGACFNH